MLVNQQQALLEREGFVGADHRRDAVFRHNINCSESQVRFREMRNEDDTAFQSSYNSEFILKC